MRRVPRGAPREFCSWQPISTAREGEGDNCHGWHDSHPVFSHPCQHEFGASARLHGRHQRQRRGQRHRTAHGLNYRPVPTSFPSDFGSPECLSKHQHKAAARNVEHHAMMAMVDAPCESTLPPMAQAILESPIRFGNALPEGASFPVVWDSGASTSVTFDESDFIGDIQPVGPLFA